MAIFGAIKTVTSMMSGYGAANVVGRWCMAAKPVNGRAFDKVCHFLGMCGLELAAWNVAEKAVTDVFDDYHNAGVNIKNAVTKKKDEPLCGDVDQLSQYVKNHIDVLRETADEIEKKGRTETAEALRAVANSMTKDLEEMANE